MTLEDLRAQKAQQQAKMRDISDRIKSCADPIERIRLTDQRRILTDMLRETRESIRRLEPGPPKRRPSARARRAQLLATDQIDLDFFGATRAVWADVEGGSWDDLSRAIAQNESADQRAYILQILRRSMDALTDRQLQLVGMMYIDGMTVTEIADELDINCSTASRILRRARGRIENFILDALSARKYLRKDGSFDFCAFAEESDAFTERQREVLYLLLSQDTTMSDIGMWLGRNRGTVSHINERIVRRLAAVAAGIPQCPNAQSISRDDWEHAPEKALCERLGISPRAYYQYVAPRIGDIPRLSYEILRMHNQDIPNTEIATQLGVTPDTVRNTLSRFKDAVLPEENLGGDYHPRPRHRRDESDVTALLRRVPYSISQPKIKKEDR